MVYYRMVADKSSDINVCSISLANVKKNNIHKYNFQLTQLINLDDYWHRDPPVWVRPIY